MKLYHNLPKEKKDALLKKRWYFQGFNGTPLPLSGPTVGNIKEGHEVLGFGYRTILEYYEGDKCYYLYDWDDLEQGLQKILKKVKENKDYLHWLLKKDEELRKVHEKVIKKVEKTDITTLPFAEAIKLYQEFSASYRKAIAISLIIECFTYPTEDLIRKTIQDELTQKGKSALTEKAITLLTGALHPSFIGKHQLAMLHIAEEAKEKGWKEIFLQKSSLELKKTLERSAEGKNILKKIEEYQQKMFWMNNAYAGAKILGVEHFIEEVKHILEKYPDPKKEILQEEEHFKTIEEQKKEFFEEHALNSELKNLIEINDAIGIIHDVRKEVITHSNHFIDCFAARFGRELNIPLEEIRYLSHYEIEETILKAISRKELLERKKKSVFITEQGETQYILSGKEAEEMIIALNAGHTHEEQEILKGHCASQGHAIGIVKVCRGMEEIAKFQESQILVACMTQPEFVPAMKKAAAIVTDEGGLTCHAAIISRELKKPCIISTKKATRVLKDGMLVEVFATEGYLKILKEN
jgi:phosphohistidine swiveling domain-containing protein/ssRNA-specific RNase YbeY (16S rRNA maturation enzyme)